MAKLTQTSQTESEETAGRRDRSQADGKQYRFGNDIFQPSRSSQNQNTASSCALPLAFMHHGYDNDNDMLTQLTRRTLRSSLVLWR